MRISRMQKSGAKMVCGNIMGLATREEKNWITICENEMRIWAANILYVRLTRAHIFRMWIRDIGCWQKSCSHASKWEVRWEWKKKEALIWKWLMMLPRCRAPNVYSMSNESTKRTHKNHVFRVQKLRTPNKSLTYYKCDMTQTSFPFAIASNVHNPQVYNGKDWCRAKGGMQRAAKCLVSLILILIPMLMFVHILWH